MASGLFSHANITDVAIVPTSGTSHPAFDAHPPAGASPVQLIDGLRLERLSDSETYLGACEPRGVNFKPRRQFGQRYAFVRESAPSEPAYHWDSDQLIQTALQLSRLIVLNSHCTEYAARRIRDWTPGSDQIIPLGIENRFYAYRVPSPERDWLTHTDAEELGSLLRTYLAVRGRLPARVRRALLRCELAFRTPYTETATAELVSAFESLVKTERHRATAQFKVRVPQLAREVGLTGITRRRAERFYGARSRRVHGDPIPVTTLASATREVRVMQTVLTGTLRRAIEDVEFRNIFKTGPRVAARWPL